MRSLGLTRALGGGIVIPLTDGKSEAGERWHALVQGFLEESRTQYIVGALKPRSLLDIWRKRMNFFETKLHLGSFSQCPCLLLTSRKDDQSVEKKRKRNRSQETPRGSEDLLVSDSESQRRR
ncbi:uncharacterized protein LOC118023968 isoform X1 [Mirounga leonina]|uniref:uncharacterized protein LOC118023968 isoform X1 n=1 Tax=Mirounga leonina TaxID=9715 RepID=UPI00156C32BC|nr:uncharacterized protein LOC118023968 isoform X1 [Mirounga leonina]